MNIPKSKLIINNQEIDILSYRFSFNKKTDLNSKPIEFVSFKGLEFEIATGKTSLFEDWAASGNVKTQIKLQIYYPYLEGGSKTMVFYDCYVVHYETIFSNSNNQPMKERVKFTCAGIKTPYAEEEYTTAWRKTFEPKITDTTSKTIIEKKHDDIVITKVTGPYDKNGKKLNIVKKNEAYFYRAHLKSTNIDVKKVNWAISYDDEKANKSYKLFSGGQIKNGTLEVKIQTKKAKEKFTIYTYTGNVPKQELSVEVFLNAQLIFTVHQRSFAPWCKFGSIYGISPNTFFGDNRGFSLKENDVNGAKKAQSLGKVTSRLYHKVLVDYKAKEIIDEIASASETKGRPLFIPGLETETNEQPYKESSLINDSLTMRLLGQDPLVVPAPNIDCKLNLNFSLNNTILTISGTVAYKAFPAYEAFIEDAEGNKVFLHTFGPIHEELLAWELMDLREMGMSPFNWLDDKLGDNFNEWKLDNPDYDYNHPVNLEIEVANNGGNLVFKKIISAKDTFRTLVNKDKVKEDKRTSRTLLGNLLLSNGIGIRGGAANLAMHASKVGKENLNKINEDLAKGLNKIKATYSSKQYENLTLEQWNNIHLNRPAADDLDLEE